MFGGCPSGWARLGSSGDWTGCGSGESPPGAREELSFSTGSLFSFRLWPELGGCSRLVVPTGCMWGPSGVCTDTGLESAAWAGPEEFIQNEGRSLTSEPTHLDSGVSLRSPLSLTLHFTVLLIKIPKVN